MQKQEILSRLKAIETALRDNQKTFIEPLRTERIGLTEKLGPIIAGFDVGDIIRDKGGRLGLCIALYASYEDSFGGQFRPIKKNGEAGQASRTMYNWDGWKLHQKKAGA